MQSVLEKSKAAIILRHTGPNVANVINILADNLNMSDKNAKNIVASAPTEISDLDIYVAHALMDELKQLNADVSVRPEFTHTILIQDNNEDKAKDIFFDVYRDVKKYVCEFISKYYNDQLDHALYVYHKNGKVCSIVIGAERIDLIYEDTTNELELTEEDIYILLENFYNGKDITELPQFRWKQVI